MNFEPRFDQGRVCKLKRHTQPQKNVVHKYHFLSREKRTYYQSITEFACIACCSSLVSKVEVLFHI